MPHKKEKTKRIKLQQMIKLGGVNRLVQVQIEKKSLGCWQHHYVAPAIPQKGR
jgi:hypothetical protein